MQHVLGAIALVNFIVCYFFKTYPVWAQNLKPFKSSGKRYLDVGVQAVPGPATA